MEKLNITNTLENFNPSESINIDRIKLTIESVKQSIYLKSKDNPEINFILKRL